MKKAEVDNLYIKDIINTNKPFFIGRIAGIELKVAYNIINSKGQNTSYDLIELQNNAGIYTKDNNSLNIYVSKLITSYENCTVIAEWDTNGKVFAITGNGQQLIRDKTPLIPKIDAISLEPYYFKESWMSALRGKRILIVHPFVKTIKQQIKNIHSIFPDSDWFKDCDFDFIQPPITLAGNHNNKDWQEHYILFIDSLNMCKDFDIALVSAGGYGMLISDYIFTKLHKSVLYIGGALQLFFGIIGKRWFENKEILKLVNDDWIRPNKDDKPVNFIQVENGCYW
jgi:hypothetical protein